MPTQKASNLPHALVGCPATPCPLLARQVQQGPTPSNARQPVPPLVLRPSSAASQEPPQDATVQYQNGPRFQPETQPSKHAAATSHSNVKLPRRPPARVIDSPRPQSEPPAGQLEASCPGSRSSSPYRQPRANTHRIQEDGRPLATPQPHPSAAATRTPGGRGSFLRSGPPRLTPRRLGALHAAGKPRASPSPLQPARRSKETEGREASPQVTEAPACFDATVGFLPARAPEAPRLDDAGPLRVLLSQLGA